MSQEAVSRALIDRTSLDRLAQQVEAMEREFDAAEESEKIPALLRWAVAFSQLAKALLVAKLASAE
jgi:hypothetical protein